MLRKIFIEIKTTWITPEALSKEFMFKCLSVMSYEQFIVSIVELIMLSWQQILIYNFHNMRVTWLFYHFFKLQVHMLHGSENISITSNLRIVRQMLRLSIEKIPGELSIF